MNTCPSTSTSTSPLRTVSPTMPEDTAQLKDFFRAVVTWGLAHPVNEPLHVVVEVSPAVVTIVPMPDVEGQIDQLLRNTQKIDALIAETREMVAE